MTIQVNLHRLTVSNSFYGHCSLSPTITTVISSFVKLMKRPRSQNVLFL